MNFKKSLRYFVQNIREKHRLSFRNQHTDREVWYMHISPMNIISGFVALILLLFIIITTTVAYTPILDFIPGYPGNKSRMILIDNIMRLDSLEQEIKNMQIYSENVALIMAGKNPVTQTQPQHTDSLNKGRAGQVATIAEDSLLRLEMEADGGPYSLKDPANARKNLRSALELYTPVKGVVSSRFDPRKQSFGVKVATTANQPVMSVLDGTVTSSAWTPGEGYTIYVQHGNNLLSIYRQNTSLLKKAGDRVRSGEIVGYTGTEQTDSRTPRSDFAFELWHNGTPVDPEGYITF